MPLLVIVYHQGGRWITSPMHIVEGPRSLVLDTGCSASRLCQANGFSIEVYLSKKRGASGWKWGSKRVEATVKDAVWRRYEVYDICTRLSNY
jgi:hypothetical protein